MSLVYKSVYPAFPTGADMFSLTCDLYSSTMIIRRS